MPPETVEYVRLWQVWFTHSNCTYDSEHDREDRSLYFEAWADASAEIELWLRGRAARCEGSIIVELISIPKAEWDALEELKEQQS